MKPQHLDIALVSSRERPSFFGSARIIRDPTNSFILPLPIDPSHRREIMNITVAEPLQPPLPSTANVAENKIELQEEELTNIEMKAGRPDCTDNVEACERPALFVVDDRMSSRKFLTWLKDNQEWLKESQQRLDAKRLYEPKLSTRLEEYVLQVSTVVEEEEEEMTEENTRNNDGQNNSTIHNLPSRRRLARQNSLPTTNSERISIDLANSSSEITLLEVIGGSTSEISSPVVDSNPNSSGATNASPAPVSASTHLFRNAAKSAQAGENLGGASPPVAFRTTRRPMGLTKRSPVYQMNPQGEQDRRSNDDNHVETTATTTTTTSSASVPPPPPSSTPPAQTVYTPTTSNILAEMAIDEANSSTGAGNERDSLVFLDNRMSSTTFELWLAQQELKLQERKQQKPPPPRVAIAKRTTDPGVPPAHLPRLRPPLRRNSTGSLLPRELLPSPRDIGHALFGDSRKCHNVECIAQLVQQGSPLLPRRVAEEPIHHEEPVRQEQFNEASLPVSNSSPSSESSSTPQASNMNAPENQEPPRPSKVAGIRRAPGRIVDRLGSGTRAIRNAFHIRKYKQFQ